MAVLAGLAVLWTLGDPGITSDEPIDVKVGRQYVAMTGAYLDRLERLGLDAIGRNELDALFADNAQHPPLGRWLVGIASTVFEPLEVFLGGADPLSVHAARLAPMMAFAVLVGLVTAEAGRRFGRVSGVVAGLSMVFMPRVFAHAHFATLDTFLSLFWTLSLFSAARAMERQRPVALMTRAGAWWGLALLTKIHAWLLPPIVFGFALLRLPTRKAIAASGVWLAVGLAIFVAGWPWLWHDSVDRLARFLSTSVERHPLRVLYFGRVYPDTAVPWHYPWVYFAVTVPVGLHVLGLVGLIRGVRRVKTDPFPMYLAASVGLFLVLFSTEAPVYDGDRLFIHVFPSWAVLIGSGFATLWNAARRLELRALLIVLLLAQGVGVVRFHPFQLSYYNRLVGGLSGAERRGLELTYWGDSIDPVLLDDAHRVVPSGQAIALAPTLHHIHPTALMTLGLFDKGITLESEQAVGQTRWLLVFRRSAYWSAEVRDRMQQGHPVAERTRQGVWLSRLYRLDTESARFTPDNREDSFRTN